MKLKISYIVVFFLLLHQPVSHAFSKLESYENKWKAGEYEQLIPELYAYLGGIKSPSILLRVRYMLGTSMCRVPRFKESGYKLLDLIPYIHRHLSPFNYQIINTEKELCRVSDNSFVIALLANQPSVSGKGFRIDPLQNKKDNEDFLKQIEEFNKRIININSDNINDHINYLKELPGSEYKATSSKYFIVIGKLTDAELVRAARNLDNTLSSFLNQFEMDPPEVFTTVYFVSSAEELKNFAKNVHDLDIPNSNWGYTFPDDFSVVVNIQGGLGTLGHEVFHVLLYHNFPDSPPWLNEGYSSLFEEYFINNGKMIGAYRENHWRLQYLQTDDWGYSYQPRRPTIKELITKDWVNFDSSRWLHLNHTTAKFFAMFLQNKAGNLETVYREFRDLDSLDASINLSDTYIETLEKAFNNLPIEEIEVEFHRWLEQGLKIDNLRPTSSTPAKSISKSSVLVKPKPISFSESGNCIYPNTVNEIAPDWVCNEPVPELRLSAVGFAKKSKAGKHFMRQIAVADAKVQLASKYIDADSPQNIIKQYAEPNLIPQSQSEEISSELLISVKVIDVRENSTGDMFVLIGLY